MKWCRQWHRSDAVGQGREGKLTSRGIDVLGVHGKALRDTDAWLDISQWVDGWADSLNLVNALDFYGTSLWWFVRVHMIIRLMELLPDVEALHHAITEVQPAAHHLEGANDHWTAVGRVVERRTPRELDPDQRENHASTPSRAQVGRVLAHCLRGGVSVARSVRSFGQPRPSIAALSYSVCKKTTHGELIRYMEPTFEPLLDELKARDYSLTNLNLPLAADWRGELRWLRLGDKTAIPIEPYMAAWIARSHFRRPPRCVARLNDGLVGVRKQVAERRWKWGSFDITEEIRAFTHSVLANRVRRAVRDIGFFEQWLSRVAPQVLVMGHEYSGLALAASAAARNLNVPVVAMQHGVIWRAHPGYVLPRTHVESIPRANALCVFGEFERRLLVERGAYSPSEIYVTGSTRLDLCAKQEVHLSRQELTLQLGLQQDVPLLLFTSTGESRLLARRLADCLVGCTAPISVIVKLHPVVEQDPSAFEISFEERGLHNVSVLKEDIDLYSLLGLADVHMSMQSSVLTEAVALDRPNLMFLTDVTADTVGYVERHVAMRVEDYASLSEAVEDVLNGPGAHRLRAGRQAFVKEHFFKLDGGAAGRAADVVSAFLG
jgi:hypothetical protein